MVAAGCLTGLLLAGFAMVIGSVWVEGRYPSDEPNRAIFPLLQRWVTRPVVVSLGRQLHDEFRRQAAERYLNNGLNLPQAIDAFLDESRDFNDRRNHAYRLAREATPSALAALRKVLGDAPAAEKSRILLIIGKAANPTTAELLASWVAYPETRVACAAIRSLGMLGDDATGRIASILTAPDQASELRIEAAATLGMIGSTAALIALNDAMADMPLPAVAAEILNGLGKFDFEEIAPAFRSFLASPDASADLRVIAVEALSNSSAAAVPYLAELARSDADPELRAAAAWAISAHSSAEQFGTLLANITRQEPEPDVRRRLYEAMLSQRDTPGDELLPVVLVEVDPAARIAGMNALGAAVRRQPGNALAGTFDAALVPELQRHALDAATSNLQMRAVFALRRAGTPAAQTALARIAEHAPPPVATAAHNGLQATPP